MDDDVRQFMLTTAWLFARHGQNARARILCEALVEADSRDGVSACALAELALADGDAEHALAVLSRARVPRSLERVEAILETRALKSLGRFTGAKRRWQRYLAAAQGVQRSWIK